MRTRRDTIKGIVIAGASTMLLDSYALAKEQTGPDQLAELFQKIENEADKMLTAIKQWQVFNKHRKAFHPEEASSIGRMWTELNLMNAVGAHGKAIGDLVAPLRPKE
jgi:hypothetical protein